MCTSIQCEIKMCRAHGDDEYPEQRRKQESVTENAGSSLMSEEMLTLYYHYRDELMNVCKVI